VKMLGGRTGIFKADHDHLEQSNRSQQPTLTLTANADLPIIPTSFQRQANDSNAVC
jgi:hypothetical protein